MTNDDNLIIAMARGLTKPQQDLAFDALVEEQGGRCEFPLFGEKLLLGRRLADKSVMKPVSENRRIFVFTPRGRLVAEYLRRNAIPSR